MKLSFSKEEQICINYLVDCLIKADGLILPEENICWNTISIKMGWDENNKVIVTDGYDMNSAISVLTKMNNNKKEFAIAFFNMIILADQRIAPEEADLIKEISLKANLPIISTIDSANVLEKYFE